MPHAQDGCIKFLLRCLPFDIYRLNLSIKHLYRNLTIFLQLCQIGLGFLKNE